MHTPSPAPLAPHPSAREPELPQHRQAEAGTARHAAGWSPLQEAAARHFEEVCELLVKHGANLDHQNNDGWTPLHEAAARGACAGGAGCLRRGRAQPLESSVWSPHARVASVRMPCWLVRCGSHDDDQEQQQTMQRPSQQQCSHGVCSRHSATHPAGHSVITSGAHITLWWCVHGCSQV
eukprot:COSAG01_NODE_5419_length_4274_cov_5.445509_6_plen_179_part_00